MFQPRTTNYTDEIIERQELSSQVLFGNAPPDILKSSEWGKQFLAYTSLFTGDSILWSKLYEKEYGEQAFLIPRAPYMEIDAECTSCELPRSESEISKENSLADFETQTFDSIHTPFTFDISFSEYLQRNLLFQLGLPSNFLIELNTARTYLLDSPHWESKILYALTFSTDDQFAKSLFVLDSVNIDGKNIDLTDVPHFPDIYLVEPIITLNSLRNPKRDLDHIKRKLESINLSAAICFDTSDKDLTEFIRILPFHKSALIFTNGRFTLLKNSQTKISSYTWSYLNFVLNDPENLALLNDININELKQIVVHCKDLEKQVAALLVLASRYRSLKFYGETFRLPCLAEILPYIKYTSKTLLLFPNVDLPIENIDAYLDLIQAIRSSAFNKNICSLMCSRYYIQPSAILTLYKQLKDEGDLYVLFSILHNQSEHLEYVKVMEKLNPQFGQNNFPREQFQHLEYTYPSKSNPNLVQETCLPEETEYIDSNLNRIISDEFDISEFNDVQNITYQTLKLKD
jgi:hypothetical protein